MSHTPDRHHGWELIYEHRHHAVYAAPTGHHGWRRIVHVTDHGRIVARYDTAACDIEAIVDHHVARWRRQAMRTINRDFGLSFSLN